MTTPAEYLKQKAEAKIQKNAKIAKQLLPLLDAYQIEDKEMARKIFHLWCEMDTEKPYYIGNHTLDMTGSGIGKYGGCWFVIDGYTTDL